MNHWKLPATWTELSRDPFLDPDAEGRYRIPLRVDEPSGLARRSHPVTSGLPIPEGALRDENAARLLDAAGRELPLQTQTLARWLDGSVKWLLLDLQLDLKPNESRKLTLEFGPGVSSSAKHPTPVSIRAVPDGVTIAWENHELRITNHELPFRLRPVVTARSTDGSRDGLYLGKVEEICIEEKGPLRAVVRVSGWHYRQRGRPSPTGDPGQAATTGRPSETAHTENRKSMPWIIRFSAWAGVPVIGAQHTFIVSDDPLTTFWRGIGIELPLVPVAASVSEVRLPEGFRGWKGRPLAHARTCETADGIALVESSVRCLGILVRDREKLRPKENYIDEASNTLGIYLWPLQGEEMDLRPVLVSQPPDFQAWKQKYPDMFERLEGGPMTPQEATDFFTGKKPCTAMGDWRARTGKGVARTHDISIAMATNTGECEALVRPFDKPLFAICPPSYYAMTGAMGRFHPRDDGNFPEIERGIETHLNWLYRHQHEWQDWDNFWDHGDYLGVYDVRRGEWWKYDDGMRGWNNGEVNTDHGPFLQFLRTGDRRHLEFAEAIARHRMDCDQCHFEDDHPEFVGGVHRHHMTEHWTGLIDGGHQWNDGMIDLWYLTGMRRALECAVEVAEFALRYGVPYAINRADTSRETNNCLRILARTFEATGDERYRDAANAIARAYLCSFDENGAEAPLEESLARLKKEFAGSEWEAMPEILEYNWHGHTGYQYIGYLAPAVQYAASLCRTPATIELARRLDTFAGSIQGDAGQFYGERYLATGDARYVMPLIRNLPQALSVPVPLDGKGDQPGSYGDARLDYLYGVPYVLAALYKARNELHRFAPKRSAEVKGYRVGSRAPQQALSHLKKNASSEAKSSKRLEGGLVGFECIDLSVVANKDPRRNPFGRALKGDDAKLLPDLKPGQIGFQPYKGDQLIHDGYLPVSAHQMYPSTASTVTPNQFALAGLPYGGEVTWGGVPYRFINPDANGGRGIIVLGANESVTIPIGQRGARLHLLGHVHGRKETRRISQFSQVRVGWYELLYANGEVEEIELINGVHFDGIFTPAYAREVEHVANFDWLHVYANLTDDQSHLNKMFLELEQNIPLESLTFRSSNEDWGLLLVAVSIEEPSSRSEEPIGLAELLTKRGATDQIDIPKTLGKQFDMETINLADLHIPDRVLDAIPVHIARSFMVVPVYKHGNTLVVAIDDPLTGIETLDTLRFILNCDVEGVVAAKEDLLAAVQRYYSRREIAKRAVARASAGRSLEGGLGHQVTWQDLPGWLSVMQRRQPDGDAMKLYAPARMTMPLSDGLYEITLALGGDPEGCVRLRVENVGRQVLADYCLPGAGQSERVRFVAEARNGALSLDLIPGQNYATGSLFPEKGFTGQYGAWWSPNGNFTRIEHIRIRRANAAVVLPSHAGLHYGWLLPGASAETLHGLIVDHEDADGNSATTMKWKAGGFRADVPNGRYRVILHHSTYAPLNSVFVDIIANGKQVCREREVHDEVFEFEADVSDGCLQIEWCQPRTHSRVPRYAIRGIVFEARGGALPQ